MTTKTKRPVQVLRMPGGSWYVTCDTCQGLFVSGLLSPVVRARLWADALWWATWHAREHDLTECGRCNHRPNVDVVRVLDGDTVKVGDRLFRRVPGGWQEAPA